MQYPSLLLSTTIRALPPRGPEPAPALPSMREHCDRLLDVAVRSRADKSYKLCHRLERRGTRWQNRSSHCLVRLHLPEHGRGQPGAGLASPFICLTLDSRCLGVNGILARWKRRTRARIVALRDVQHEDVVQSAAIWRRVVVC